MIKKLLLITLCLIGNRQALAGKTWDEVRFDGLQAGKKYSVSSGTGFFINSNYLVTSRHVVENCLNIAIRGAVEPTKVQLAVADTEQDLAILYSPLSPKRIPYLRTNYDQLKVGDIIFTIGYPLEHGVTGEYILKQAEVLQVLSDTKYTEVEFTDSVDHGNSGGPVLDKNSNIIGVVKAKGTYYKNDDPSQITKVVGIAVGLDGLIAFLKQNNMIFAANSSYDIFTNYQADKLAKDYIVNIHCLK